MVLSIQNKRRDLDDAADGDRDQGAQAQQGNVAFELLVAEARFGLGIGHVSAPYGCGDRGSGDAAAGRSAATLCGVSVIGASHRGSCRPDASPRR
jgi:hypothetical protein